MTLRMQDHYQISRRDRLPKQYQQLKKSGVWQATDIIDENI
jgi:hypothetical protein